ncbi:MAG: hypothetical protein GKR89_14925 [Candidatus Latescibacteria bacterium]|nr:hypothetical protein [Candidatus Latescibacterota bacterium]
MRVGVLGGMALVLVGAAAAEATPGPFFAPGRTIITGNGNLFYNGEESGQLAQTVGTIILAVFAAAVAGEEEEEWDCCDEDSWWDDEDFGLRVAKTQVDLGVGVALAPGLVVGGRSLVKTDTNGNAIQALWGAGPEITYFGNNGHSVQPFVGAGYFFSQGRANRPGDNALRQGRAWQVRSGVHMGGEKTGFLLQLSFQSDRLQSVGGDPFASRTVGLGMGFSVALY